MSQKGFASTLIILLVTLLLICSGGGYYYFIYAPQATADYYLELSQPIVIQLNKTIEILDKDIQESKNIKLDYKDAKAALDDHAQVYLTAKSKVEDLKKQYRQIKTTQSIRQVDFMINQQFDLVDNILVIYGQDLDYRLAVFDAYGESFPQSIVDFTKLFYSGGQRADYILATQKVVDLSQQTLYGLENIKVPDNDKEDYHYRKDTVTAVKESFTKLNDYYRHGQDQAVTEEVTILTSQFDTANKQFETIVDNYVINSSVTKNIHQYQKNSESINQQFKNVQKN